MILNRAARIYRDTAGSFDCLDFVLAAGSLPYGASHSISQCDHPMWKMRRINQRMTVKTSVHKWHPKY
jgi:hypothetical protein